LSHNSKNARPDISERAGRITILKELRELKDLVQDKKWLKNLNLEHLLSYVFEINGFETVGAISAISPGDIDVIFQPNGLKSLESVGCYRKTNQNAKNEGMVSYSCAYGILVTSEMIKKTIVQGLLEKQHIDS
jgi:hypothetical protein